MPLRTVNAGQDVAPEMTHQTWNAFITAALAEQLRERKRVNFVDPVQEIPLNDIPVKNARASTVNWYGVLGIDDFLFDPGTADGEDSFKARPALKGVTPIDPDHLGKFVICGEPMNGQDVGQCAIDGVVPCQVFMNDVDHVFADIKNGEVDHLESKEYGAAQIVVVEGGTGVRWALIRFGTSLYMPVVAARAILTVNMPPILGAYGISSFFPIKWGPFSLDVDPVPTSAENEYVRSGQIGFDVLLYREPQTSGPDKWVIHDVTHIDKRVMCDLEIDEIACQIFKFDRRMAIMSNEPSDTKTLIHTGDKCPT